MNNNEYRKQWIKWHESYERTAYVIFRKAIKESFKSLPIDNITYANYKIVVDLNINPVPVQRAYYLVYRNIGLIHGRRVGFGINREIKRFDNDLFSQEFQERILDWVRYNCGDRIVSVNRTTTNKIKRLIYIANQRGYSVEEMRVFLKKNINLSNFTKYQASRIARTETTTAANYAAHKAALSSSILLQKVWIATKDNRTRDGYPEHWDHLGMDGVVIPLENDFHFTSTTGEKNDIQYPGAPNTVAGNGINCRCVLGYRPVRDENGFAISR